MDTCLLHIITARTFNLSLAVVISSSSCPSAEERDLSSEMTSDVLPDDSVLSSVD